MSIPLSLPVAKAIRETVLDNSATKEVSDGTTTDNGEISVVDKCGRADMLRSMGAYDKSIRRMNFINLIPYFIASTVAGALTGGIGAAVCFLVGSSIFPLFNSRRSISYNQCFRSEDGSDTQCLIRYGGDAAKIDLTNTFAVGELVFWDMADHYHVSYQATEDHRFEFSVEKNSFAGKELQKIQQSDADPMTQVRAFRSLFSAQSRHISLFYKEKKVTSFTMNSFYAFAISTIAAVVVLSIVSPPAILMAIGIATACVILITGFSSMFSKDPQLPQSYRVPNEQISCPTVQAIDSNSNNIDPFTKGSSFDENLCHREQLLVVADQHRFTKGAGRVQSTSRARLMSMRVNPWSSAPIVPPCRTAAAAAA